MKPDKVGQVAKFHTPFPDEDPDQLYVVTEINDDTETPRAFIRELNTNYPIPSSHVVLLEDLEVVESDTTELYGKYVTILKADHSKSKGRVLEAARENIILNLKLTPAGVQTNVLLKIQDDSRAEQLGYLLVDPNTNFCEFRKKNYPT